MTLPVRQAPGQSLVPALPATDAAAAAPLARRAPIGKVKAEADPKLLAMIEAADPYAPPSEDEILDLILGELSLPTGRPRTEPRP